jgi:hypothetical protein
MSLHIKNSEKSFNFFNYEIFFWGRLKSIFTSSTSLPFRFMELLLELKFGNNDNGFFCHVKFDNLQETHSIYFVKLTLHSLFLSHMFIFIFIWNVLKIRFVCILGFVELYQFQTAKTGCCLGNVITDNVVII